MVSCDLVSYSYAQTTMPLQVVIICTFLFKIFMPTFYRLKLVLQAKPNQPQRRSLSVSRTGKEGSGDTQ